MNLDSIDTLGEMFFEGMNIGWIGVDRRGRQEGYRDRIRHVAKLVLKSRKRCGPRSWHEPLAAYFRKLLSVLGEMEKAPFPEDYYPAVMECGADGFRVCSELIAELASQTGKSVSTLQRVRSEEWEEKSRRSVRVAANSLVLWREARVRNAFSRVSGYSAHGPHGDIAGFADCWLDLADALRAAGLQSKMSQIACHDTSECQLASSLLIDLADPSRYDELVEMLGLAQSERWAAYEKLPTALQHLGSNAFRLLRELVDARAKETVIEQPTTSGPVDAEVHRQDTGQEHDVAAQVILLGEFERQIIVTMYEQNVGKESDACPSQETLASWLGRDCNTPLKQTLSCLVKSQLIGNWSHVGRRGGYYLTSRGIVGARLIEADQS